jgi:hypothetical protein
MFNLSVLRWTYRVIPSKFWTRYEEQTSWIYRVIPSKLNQNFYIESHCMFNLSVLYVWFKTFGCNHPLCSTCQFFMSGSKPLDVITLYVQLVSTSCLVQNPKVLNRTSWTYRVIPSKFWTRYEEQTSWIYRVIPSKLNVLVLNIAEKFTLYVQLVSTSCLVQNLWM